MTSPRISSVHSRLPSMFSRLSPVLALALVVGLASACKSSNGASQGSENANAAASQPATAAPAEEPVAAPAPSAAPMETAPVEAVPAAAPAPAADAPVAAAPAGGPPSADAPGYTGKEPCEYALKGDSPVAKACLKGGMKEAKKIMKAMVKKGRAAGLDYECDSCHKDGGGMVDGTKERFEKLVASYKK